MVQLYVRIMSALRSKSEDGAVATEYGVLVAFLAILLVGSVTLMWEALDGFFERVAGEIDSWAP
jgi:pilus assembly protein Flp/PilA